VFICVVRVEPHVGQL